MSRLRWTWIEIRRRRDFAAYFGLFVVQQLRSCLRVFFMFVKYIVFIILVRLEGSRLHTTQVAENGIRVRLYPLDLLIVHTDNVRIGP